MSTVALLGGTGTVGQGAALAFLKKGYEVVITSRSNTHIDTLKQKLTERGADVKKLHFVIGDFDSEANADKVHADVVKALGGSEPTHVLVNLGFISGIQTPLSETTPEQVISNLNENIWPQFRATKAFVPHLKADGKKHSFTTLSGGLAHGVYVPQLWAATLKNGIANQLALILSAEFRDTKISYKNICIHFGVASFGNKQNQLGMPSVDTELFGPYFVAIAERDNVTGTQCVNTLEDAQKFVESK